ncbi:MAG: tetratricopeptide repeat protein [Acidobacteria bacterium]|nr:tetratricopeptide repeat protein [Acidobacteriota bacterium]
MRRKTVPIVILCLAAGIWLAADFNKAVSLFKREQFREALQEITPVVNENPDWEFGHRLVGLCYYHLKEYDKAVRAFEKARALKSTEPAVYLGLAESYYNLAQPDKAAAVLAEKETLLLDGKRRSDRFSFYKIRSYVLFEQKKYAAAADAMMEAFALSAGKGADWLLLGISYYKTEQNDKAAQALNKAQQLDPTLTEAGRYLLRLKAAQGERALKNRDYNRARQLFSEVVAQDPYDPALKLNLGLAEIGLKNWQAAADVLLPLESAADSYRYFYYTGYVMEKLEKNTQARRFYERAAEMSATDEVRAAIQRVRHRSENQ